MNLQEHAAKQMVLRPAGIPVPSGIECASVDEVRVAFAEIGPCMVKAQVPTGRRGKAGGIRAAGTAGDAAAAASAMLGTRIEGHVVASVLVEERAIVARNFYAAVLADAVTRAPMLLFSAQGGVDIEEVAARDRAAVRRASIDILSGFDDGVAARVLAGLDLGDAAPRIADILGRLYRAFRQNDAELIEVNPLALLADGRLAALDCKFILDPAAACRRPELARAAARERRTDLEVRAAEAGLKYIELDGSVGVLANGAGLTMATMDVVSGLGGRPANFLEIGGDAYTKAEAALGIVLSHQQIRSLVINFCGAFARTDVMAAGIIKAWERVRPTVPTFFSIHGTGEAEAVALVRERLGLEPFDLMEDAVKAAVEAAR
jgi:succinyl-CoA synthetase beta subunit